MRRISKDVIQERGTRLYEARALTRLSGAQFAKMHNIKYHTYNRWEKGYSNLTPEIAKLCSEALLKNNVVCSSKWLLNAEGTNPISLITDTPNVNNIKFIAQDISIYSEINLFKTSTKNSVVIMIKDDDMLPFYGINDYVGGVLVEPEHIDKCHKRNCIIRLGQHLVARAIYMLDSKSCNLVCTNPLSKNISPITMQVSKIQPHIIVYHRQLLV